MEVIYNGEVNNKIVISLYNMNGQKLANKQIQQGKTIITAPVSGVYIVVLNNE